MIILAVNAGSSSLKLKLYDMPNGEMIFGAVFERIGLANPFYVMEINNTKEKKESNFTNYDESIEIFLNELRDTKTIMELEDIKGIGHRVVHGGSKYYNSLVIDDEVITDIEKLTVFAPLHNKPNVLGIKSFKKILPKAISVAVFDTAFYQLLTDDKYIYALPYEWYSQNGVRKYGFHGISHNYIDKRMTKILANDNLKIISCHLGNGGSVTAVKNGKALDTSFGFTPISGIPMGTRSGDIDVSIIPYIMETTNQSLEAVMDELNNNSGLLGISGISSDFRDIEQGIKDKNERCLLAFNIYVNRILSFISYYNIILGGIDVLVFTAGIGENSIQLRKKIIECLQPLGVIIDEEANKISGRESLISAPYSSIKCYVIPTNEELMIVEDTYTFLK